MAALPKVLEVCNSANAWPTDEPLTWPMAVSKNIFPGDRIPFDQGDKAVELYRQFYIIDKSDFASWAYLEIPDWWPYSQFPAGMAYCKLNKAYFSGIDQIDMNRRINEKDNSQQYVLAESFKKKRKKKEKRPPTVAERVRAHIKSRLTKQIPRLSTINKWVEEMGPSYPVLLDRANTYIEERHEYRK